MYAKTCEDYSVFSDHVSSSAGVELMHCEILMMLTRRREPSSKTPRSKFQNGARSQDDAIDLAGTRCVESARGSRGTNTIVTAIVKADPAASVRGRRTTMLSDSTFTRRGTPESRGWGRGGGGGRLQGVRVGRGGASGSGRGRPVCVISRVAREGERGDRSGSRSIRGARFGNCREKRPRIFNFRRLGNTLGNQWQIFQRAKIFPRLVHHPRTHFESAPAFTGQGLSLPHATHMTATSTTIRALAHPRATRPRAARARKPPQPRFINETIVARRR